MIGIPYVVWPEMLLWPYLIIKGWLPYKDIAMAHNPLLIFALSGWMKTSQYPPQVVIQFTLLLALGTAALIFKVSKNITAVLIWASLWFIMEGSGLWFESLLTFLAIFTFWLVLKKNWFWAGVMWGIMFLSKQTAVWFLIPILLQIPAKKFFLGVVLIFSGYLLLLWKLNITHEYILWAIRFGIFILPKSAGQIQFPTIKNLILVGMLLVPGIISGMRKNWNLALWSVCGILGVWPRWEFFHLQPGLPFLAIATTIMPKTKLSVYVAVLVILSIVFVGRTVNKPNRFIEPETFVVVSYVTSHTGENDTIFVWDFWDNIYSMANRIPATQPWIPQLPWYLNQTGVKEKLLSDLENNTPKLIVARNEKDFLFSDFLIKNYHREASLGEINIYRHD